MEFGTDIPGRLIYRSVSHSYAIGLSSLWHRARKCGQASKLNSNRPLLSALSHRGLPPDQALVVIRRGKVALTHFDEVEAPLAWFRRGVGAVQSLHASGLVPRGFSADNVERYRRRSHYDRCDERGRVGGRMSVVPFPGGSRAVHSSRPVRSAATSAICIAVGTVRDAD